LHESSLLLHRERSVERGLLSKRPAGRGEVDRVAWPGATECWAVGALVENGSQDAGHLIEHYNGQSWSMVPAPNASGFLEGGLSALA
jgi:hypothetical protein